MKKVFNQAPLPFMGQKRRFANEFKVALRGFGDKTVFVDLFGGSGLLSHITKSIRPDATVIYNDYDGYHKRIENIPRTNSLISSIQAFTCNSPKGKIIKEPYRAAILDLISQESRTGFVDYITLSSSLLFSMNYATSFEQLSKQSFYNTIRQGNYNADGYLEGIEIVKKDYTELFQHWKHHPNVVFLVDPPYLSTEVGSYSCYWRLANYLDVLLTVRGTSYFYFTSNKSSILELCEWIETNLGTENPFKGATKKEIFSSIGT